MLAVLQRGDPVTFFEAVAEIVGVIVSDGSGDRSDFVGWILKQFLRLRQADVRQQFREGGPVSFQDGIDVGNAVIEALRRLLQGIGRNGCNCL